MLSGSAEFVLSIKSYKPFLKANLMYTAHSCSGIYQSLNDCEKYVTETQNCEDKWLIKKQSAPLIIVQVFIVFMIMWIDTETVTVVPFGAHG